MMIERNLGYVERIVRLLRGLMLAGWVLSRPDINGIDLFVTVISVALILNGVFSRCYFWYLLDIDTSNSKSGRSATRCESV